MNFTKTAILAATLLATSQAALAHRTIEFSNRCNVTPTSTSYTSTTTAGLGTRRTRFGHEVATPDFSTPRASA